MQNEFIERMTTGGQAVCSALQSLSEINKKMLKDSTELQLSFANYCFDKSLEWTQLTGKTTSYMDFLDKETKFASQYNKKMMELGNKAVNIITKARDEAIVWFEESIASAEKETKPATKGLTKK